MPGLPTLPLPFAWPRRLRVRSVPSGGDQRSRTGTRSLADLIAPAAVEVTRDHLRLEQQYVRVLAVTGYPRTVSPGWLDPLLRFAEPLEVSLHLNRLESAPMISTLTHQLAALHSSRLLADRHGRLADPERETAYEDAERLRDALQRGDQQVFSVSLYVQVRATSPQGLDLLTQRVERTLDGMLTQSRVALFEQDRGFASCLPQADDRLGVGHNMDTSSVVTMFPFSASALTMPAGVLYGIATDSQTPVLIDPFDRSLENSNLAIFATSGAGKSFFCKLLLLRSMLRGIDAIVIDPEDEYRVLCRAVDGQYVRLASSSGQHLNPFDLPLGDSTDGEERDPLAEQVVALLAFLELMAAEPGQPLTNQECGLLDRALHQTYAEAGIQRGRPATYARPAPLLRDLYGVLTRSEDAVAQDLASRLERYVLGSLAGLFDGPTNVALDSRFLVFNLQRLERELRPLAIHAITSFVWSRVRQEIRPRLLVVDEAWSLLQYEQGAAFLDAMARRARKYALGLVTITQDVADALGNAHGRTVLTNAACTLLLKQSSSTIGPVADAFALSNEERHYLLGAAKGEGLLFCRNTHLALRVVASPKEYALATTAPQDRTASDVAQSGQSRPWLDQDGAGTTRPLRPSAKDLRRRYEESEA